jgi:hypothetical protein
LSAGQDPRPGGGRSSRRRAFGRGLRVAAGLSPAGRAPAVRDFEIFFFLKRRPACRYAEIPRCRASLERIRPVKQISTRSGTPVRFSRNSACRYAEYYEKRRAATRDFAIIGVPLRGISTYFPLRDPRVTTPAGSRAGPRIATFASAVDFFSKSPACRYARLQGSRPSRPGRVHLDSPCPACRYEVL